MSKRKQKEPKDETIFTVTVTRMSYASTDILVRGAANAKDAAKSALERAGDFEFRESTAEYEVEGVRDGE